MPYAPGPTGLSTSYGLTLPPLPYESYLLLVEGCITSAQINVIIEVLSSSPFSYDGYLSANSCPVNNPSSSLVS